MDGVRAMDSDAELIEGSLRDPGRFAAIFDRHGARSCGKRALPGPDL
jgi:hypothetical protein